MIVKICGIKSLDTAHWAAQMGADLLGFVFAPSKRQIEPINAAAIASSLSTSIQTVGVFVNESLENICSIAKQVGLDYVQLHGDEPPEFAKEIPYKRIKAFPVNEAGLATIKDYPCDYYLLDSPIGENRGGNGTSFDWRLVHNLSIDNNKIILAGGLTPENIQTAITMVQPVGVDVSSGVETNGEKDMLKIQQFITKAKAMEG